MKGDIVLIKFPFTDFSAFKKRPSLVLYDTGVDIVAAYISSELSPIHTNTDVYINRKHPESIDRIF